MHEALNYFSEAQYDDGSCVYGMPGCTDPKASNYDLNANMDDNSCRYDDEKKFVL